MASNDRSQQQRSAPRAPSRFPLEVQIHPAAIRRGVRYLFVERRHAALAGVGLVLFAGLIGFGAVVAPRVVASVVAQRELGALEVTRERLERRVAGLGSRLADLGDQSEALELQVRKIYLAYGLEQEAKGLGGYPIEAREYATEIASSALLEAARLEARLKEREQVLGVFLREISEFEERHQDEVRTTPSISPLRGEFLLTSPFGNRRSPFTKAPDFHSGIDLSAPKGTPVYAAADGVVVFAGRYNARRSIAWWRYGNLVSIRHGEDFVTLYAHLDRVDVKRGQRVEQGEKVGAVGNTGWSTNPHLHYEVRRLIENGKDRAIDPRIYILDHRWRDEERLLVSRRSAPDIGKYEPLPRRFAR